MARAGLAAAGAVLLLLAAMAGKNFLITLPSPPTAPAPGQFDENRAAGRLARILRDERPHPVDSEASDGVRSRLIAEMRAVGLDPRITDDFTCNGGARSRAITCARVRNLAATIGPAEGRHLLLSAHYDSTVAGPGAADDGIGVASLLEIAALLRGRRLGRPVTFLINEGEEMGLLGARAFLTRDPLASRVDTLINLEARGVQGPAIMFETSQPNAAAIALYHAAATQPVANSLTTDLYRLIPNSTDVAVFEDRPWTILNFAIIGNETRYHTAGDTLAALDRRSLQHMGAQALAAARLAATETLPPATGQRLYMDILGLQLIVLPLMAGLVLLGFLFVFFAVTSWRRAALGRPLAAIVVAIAGAQMTAWLGQFVVGLIRSGDYWRGLPWVTTTAVYASAITAGLIALRFVAKDAEVARLRAAFWLVFMAAGAALAWIAPGAAIFFLLPPLVMAAGMIARRHHRRAELGGSIAAILLLYLTFGPALGLFEEMMNGGPHWMFAPLGVIILLPALIELKPLLGRVRPIFAVAGAGDLVLIGWAAVALVPAYSANRQQAYTIDYAWDADARKGRWTVNNDGTPVPHAGDWARAELPYSTRQRWVSAAPAIPAPGPAVTLIGESREGGGRRLRLRLAMNDAESASLIAMPETRLRAGGSGAFVRPFGQGGPRDRWSLRCVGRSCEGATIDLVTDTATPLELLVMGVRSGLPAAAAAAHLLASRPANARPQYGTDSVVSYARIRL